jgi:hypothetical protein
MGEFIRVSQDGHGFIEGAEGKRFVPFGANYFDPKTGWAPKIWERYDGERVARQLGQMAEAGLNSIRVFLDQQVLNPAPGEYPGKGFDTVDDLVRLAAKAGVRIIFSGPNTWHGTPAHRRGDMFADPKQIDFALRLWEKIVERWGREPTVMAWDLLNEPMVGWPLRSEHRLPLWRRHAKEKLGIEVGEDLPPPDPTGRDKKVWGEYLRFQEGLATDWVTRQCRAIREAGAGQMISVGLIQWSIPILLPGGMGWGGFNPARIAPALDYMSIHFYPMLRNAKAGLEPELAVQRAYLEVVLRASYRRRKPLVLEEFGWKGGKVVPGEDRAWPEEHQTLWGETLMASSAPCCSGWLNWGYADAADPKADVSAASGLWTEDEKPKHWGKRFAEYAAKFKASPPTYAPAARRLEVDRLDFLYERHGAPQLEWLEKNVGACPGESIEVVFKE